MKCSKRDSAALWAGNNDSARGRVLMPVGLPNVGGEDEGRALVRRTSAGCSFDASAVLDHDPGIAQDIDMAQRVAPDRNYVRELAFRNRA